ncbi:MAG: GNAT family N-acetyltransferase [Promethearchaeota archaeon]
MEDSEFNTFIEGQKVDLMPMNTNHINLYVKWANNPRVRIYARHVLPRTVQQIKKYLENQKKKERTFIDFEIWLKVDKKPIGDIGLFNINWFDRKAYVGLTIGELECWGQGICTEAVKLITGYSFNELNLNKLYAYIYAPNIASFRCFEKNGYKCEATLKQDVYINGEFLDTYLYSILKEDWM